MNEGSGGNVEAYTTSKLGLQVLENKGWKKKISIWKSCFLIIFWINETMANHNH